MLIASSVHVPYRQMPPVLGLEHPHVHAHPLWRRSSRGPMGVRAAGSAVPGGDHLVALDIGVQRIQLCHDLHIIGGPIAAYPAGLPA